MEGLVLHGAAHVFFENKLGELETQINSKFKKIENKLKKEMKDIFQYQSHEISKIKVDIQGIKEELNVIKQSEETITQKGMTKLSKLSKEVKTELNEIKKLKTDVNGLKKEVIGIRQSEEDLSKMGMDKLAKMNEDFKSDVKQLRTEMKSVKKDIVSIKVASNKKMIEADPEPGENDVTEPDKEKEKIKLSNSSRKRSNSYREPKVPPTITELLNSSEEEIEKTVDDKNKAATNAEASNNDNDSGDKAMPNNDTNMKENGVLQSFGGADYQDNYLQNYNDDHIRKLVFSSQESSDYHHESSEYHESDAVSDDEDDRNHHFDKTFNVKRIFSKKFLYK